MRYKKLIRAFISRFTRAIIKQHRHCLRRCGAFIQKGSVRNFHTSQIHNHGLKIQQSLQPTLRNFRLVGRVSGVPTGVFQYIALNHGRHNRVVITQTNIGVKGFIFGGKGAQMFVVMKLG